MNAEISTYTVKRPTGPQRAWRYRRGEERRVLLFVLKAYYEGQITSDEAERADWELKARAKIVKELDSAEGR